MSHLKMSNAFLDHFIPKLNKKLLETMENVPQWQIMSPL